MKHSLYTLAPAGLCLLPFAACEDALEETPESYYTRKDFFVNAQNADMAVTGIYNMMVSNYGYIDGQNTAASDDTMFPGGGLVNDNDRRDMGNYTLDTDNRSLGTLWAGKYEQLNRANYTIQNIEAMKGYGQNAELKKLVAEAKFLRAQVSLDLARYWGDVPYKTYYTTNYEDAYQPRTDRDQIFGQVVKDLNDAKAVLPWATADTNPERATQGAARALLMRALLARAGYRLQMDGEVTLPADAERKACFEAVIEEWEAFENEGTVHGFYDNGSADSYEKLFKGFCEEVTDCRESLLEVAFNYPNTKGYWGTYLGPRVAAPNVPTGEATKYMGRANASFLAVPEWFYFFEAETAPELTPKKDGMRASYPAIDRRRDIALCTYQYTWSNDIGNHVYKEDITGRNWYPGKWRREWMSENLDLNCTNANYCLLRYADVVLMAAEAYNETGDTDKAWTLLNRVRHRAGATEVQSLAEYRALTRPRPLYDLPFFDSGTEQDDFRTALYWERSFELAFEGQRKQDLLRWGVMYDALQTFGDDTAANQSSLSYIAPTTFTAGKHELMPIPRNEMQVNYKLEGKNNPGY